MRGILQGGGKGERLKPLTDRIPKCLAEIEQEPLLGRLISQFADASVEQITVVAGWLGVAVQDYVANVAVPMYPAIRFTVITEDAALGNAGILRTLAMPTEPVMFSFADLYTDLNFTELAAHHQRTGAALTLAVHWDQVAAPFGAVTVDGSRVSQYVEKPSFRYLAGSGAAVMSPAVFPALARLPERFGISDVVQSALALGLPVEAWFHDGFWIDVNSSALLAVAEALARSNRSVR